MKENILKNDKSSGKSMFLPQIIGVVVSVVSCFAFLMMFAAILANYSLNETAVIVFALVSQTLSSLIGGFAAAKIYKQSGFVIGIINGAVLFIVFTALSMIFSSGGLGAVTVIRLFLIIISSALGGILGVNLKRKKKLI